MTLLLATLLLAQSDPWATPVEFHSEGETIARVVERLSELTGQELEVSKSLKEDLIIVHTQSSTPREVADQLAWAARGKWEIVEKVKTLTSARPSPAQAQARLKAKRLATLNQIFQDPNVWPEEGFADRVQKLSEAFDEAQGTGTRQTSFDLVNQVQTNQPERRLFMRIAHKIGLENLAEIPIGQTQIFTNTPNAFAIPLPPEVISYAVLFREESEIWRNLGINARMTNPGFKDHPPITEKSSVIVEVTANPTGIHLTLKAYDESGRSQIINGPGFPSGIPFNETGPKLPPGLAEKLYRPSDPAINAFQIINTPTGSNDPDRTAFIQQLIKEESPDPLLTVKSDLLKSISIETGRLVVAVPDEMSPVSVNLSTVQPYHQAIPSNFFGDYEVQNTDSVYAFRPANLSWGRPFQIPRENLRNSVTELTNEPMVSMIRLSNAVGSLDYEVLDATIRLAQRILATTKPISAMTNFKSLKAISMLTKADQAQLQAKGTIEKPFNSLPTPLKQFLTTDLTTQRNLVRKRKSPRMDATPFDNSGSADFAVQPHVLLNTFGEKDIIVQFSIAQMQTAITSRGTSNHIYPLETMVQRLYPTLDPTKPNTSAAENYYILPVSTATVDILIGDDAQILWFTYFPTTNKTPKIEALDSPPPVIKDKIEELRRQRDGGY